MQPNTSLLSRSLTALGLMVLLAAAVLWYRSLVRLSVTQELISHTAVSSGETQDHIRLLITNHTPQDVRLVTVSPLC